MTKGIVISALQMAIWRRSPTPGLISHSDRGSQYCGNDFQKFLKKHKMISSMSPGKRKLREGNCWDNSVAESFFGSLKTERVHDVLYSTRQTARNDIIDYIEMFYNSRRRHSFLGYLCPNEFEKLIEF